MVEFKKGDNVKYIYDKKNCKTRDPIGYITGLLPRISVWLEGGYNTSPIYDNDDLKLIGRKNMKYKLGQVLVKDGRNSTKTIVEINNGFYHCFNSISGEVRHTTDEDLDKAGWKPQESVKETIVSMDEVAEKFGVPVAQLKIKKD